MPLYKSFIILIIGTISVSCNSSKTLPPETDELIPNTRAHVLVLPDSLGSVEFLLPNRYDTFLKWTHFSDCSSCDWNKYRFQPKKLPIFKESGWIWDDLTDSVDGFTISHSAYIEKVGWKGNRIDSTPQRTAEVGHRHILANAKTDSEMRYVKIETVQQINGSWFSIIAGENYDSSSKVFSKYVLGTSTIRLNQIDFKFLLRTKRNDSISKYFIQNSIDLIKRVKIKPCK